MAKMTIMLIPDDARSTKQIALPKILVKLLIGLSFGMVGLLGYLVFDYVELRSMRHNFYELSAENEGLKGEARILMSNLEEVKRSLRRVQDYTSKLGELTRVKVQKVRKQTGIGPLSPEEYEKALDQQATLQDTPGDYLPIGVNLDNLIFRPVFDQLTNIGSQSNHQAVELQQILSDLSKQKSLLSSIPSITPVNGWVASGFGRRISPFTGEVSIHKGIDLASPVGTPIYSPADGVVIFTGSKAGFGNFIMIAHGYGIVSNFGHNSENMVQPGQQVKRGDQIGTVGMTGRTTGPHVHYEVIVNGIPNNPKNFILDMEDNLLQ